MIEQVTVMPDKLASRSGGDRYAGQLIGKNWAIYLPQEVTRSEYGRPIKSIKITIETIKED